MDQHTRRKFLKGVSLGTAAFFSVAEAAGQGQMPGLPPSGDSAKTAAPPSNVMAIAAHPGDAFFAMGAPVAMAARQGGQGVFLSLTLGERGSATIPPKEYGDLQREASNRAARGLAAEAVFLNYPDGEVPVSRDASLAVCDLIRQYKPQVVVTHWRGSWHKDHRACYQVVTDAIFYAALPALTRSAPAHSVSKTYFADNWEDAKGFVPDTYLDITPVFDPWATACATFPMWRGENGFRYKDYYCALAVCRGCVSGFYHAVALMSPPEQLVSHTRSL